MNEPIEYSKSSSERGKLRLFIGAAPGVGKTYTMLREANTLAKRGIDTVIGYIDTHNRLETLAQLGELEVIVRKSISFRGRDFQEIDVDAILERKPKVVVIDELAHSNVPGSRHEKRYMDVEYLLAHGIHVLTAVNVQHIEGIREEAQAITGIKVREIIPKSFVKQADEIEVIDVTPETLRQRLRDGSIYTKDKIDQALNHFFRKANLQALRELALREVADDVDERLLRSYDRTKIRGPIGAKETILVCVSYGKRSELLIATGSRIADRMKADFLVLTVFDQPEDELTQKAKATLTTIRQLAEKYNAEHVIAFRNDMKLGKVILEKAEELNATQVVVGQPKAGVKWRFWRDSPVAYLLQHLKYVDLRIVGWKETGYF